jgi:F0F1-type ATP synthase delta subunit
MNSSDALVNQLLTNLQTTATVKQVSDALEELSQNKTFKRHANLIVSDHTLTDKQKQSQLLYLVQTIDVSALHDFLADTLVQGSTWLFSSDKVDYFDKFVQNFQLATESLQIVYLVTAIDLNKEILTKIAVDLSQSFGYKVIIDHEVNPAILGGAQVRIENMVYDHSLRRKFQQFQRQWLATFDQTEKKLGYHEPQVGLT